MGIEPMGKGLLGTILRYDYEVRDEKELFRNAPSPKVPREMISLASHILDGKSGHFDPSQFKDEFETELRKLVKRKAAGKPIERPGREDRPSNVVDLMEALRRSISGRGNRAAALRSSSSSTKTARPRTRKASAKKRGTRNEASGVTTKGGEVRRRIAFDAETYLALDRLAKDRMQTILQLAEEAFRDLLKKHRRATTLTEMLQDSVRAHPANDHKQVGRRRHS